MADVRVRVLGGFEIDGVEPVQLGSRKARTLLKVLSLARGRPVTVDALAECLWRDDPPARPAEQVRVLVSRLRGVLGADRLPRADAGYAFAVDWLDLDALGELVDEACRRMAAGSPGLARAAVSGALALARGPLLPEEPDAEWAEADRALAGRLEGTARQVGAEAALATGDLVVAALMAQGALDRDPYDEVVLRTLMRALAKSGKAASALAEYAAVRARLAEDLGVDPAPETEALHTEILLAPPESPPGSAPATEATNLPGRANALTLLEAALAEAAAGRGALVIIEGEAGIGKSSLVTLWSSRARAASAVVLTGRCEELARGLPLQVVIAALQDHLQTLEAAEADELLGTDVEVLGPLLGWRPAGSPVPTSSLRDQLGHQLVVFAALVNVFTRLPRPTVLILDDIHLAGSATLEWLNYAARRAAGLSLLIVCAQRAEEAIPIPPSSVIELEPLDEDAAAEVVGRARAHELVTRSGGNPLFLIELAAADPAEGLPATIRDAVMARCERAGPAAAATLRTAALLGPVVDLDLLAAVARASPVELLDQLEEGMRRGLLVERAPGFHFRHDLIREALAASAGAARRALVHREAAHVLAGRPRPDPLAVAYHARLGGDEELAASASLEAAAIASAQFDQPEALRLVDESLALVDSLAGRLLRARVLMMLGDYDRAGDDAAAARGMGGGAAAVELGAWAAHYRRDFMAAVRLADEGAAEEDADVDDRVGCLGISGWASQSIGDLRAAEQRFADARVLAQGTWKPICDVWLGGLRMHQGRYEEATALIQPAIIDQSLDTHGYPALHAHLFGAIALGNLGRAGEALAAVAALENEVARTSAARWSGRADNVRGWILRGLGEWEAADDANTVGLERSSAISMVEPMAHSHLDLAAGALVAGDLDRAASEIDLAQAVGVRHALAWRHSLRAGLYRGEIALAARDLDGARAIALEVTEKSRRFGTLRYDTLAFLLLARAHLVAGETVDLAEVEAHLGRLPTLAGTESWRLTGMVAAAAGVEGWWTLAETQVAELSTHAGEHAGTLQREARATLDRMRTVSRRA